MAPAIKKVTIAKNAQTPHFNPVVGVLMLLGVTLTLSLLGNSVTDLAIFTCSTLLTTLGLVLLWLFDALKIEKLYIFVLNNRKLMQILIYLSCWQLEGRWMKNRG